MSDFTMRVTTSRGYDEAVAAARAELAEAGFGVLTEIDLAATLRAKLGVEVAPQVILGACRPQLAHAALQAEPSIAALLPCNVVVRSEGERTVVEAFDPQAMIAFAEGADPALREVALDARERLGGALDRLAD